MCGVFWGGGRGGGGGLAFVGVLNSVVSVYYYFAIAHRMFFREPSDDGAIPVGAYVCGGVALAVVGVLLFGLYPEPLLAGVRASTQILP